MARLSKSDRQAYERQLADAMADTIRRLATKAADHLRSRALTATADMPAEWWDDETALDEAEGDLRPVIAAAATGSATAVATKLGAHPYHGGPELDTFTADRTKPAARSLIDTVRADIDRRIADAADDEEAAFALDTYAAKTQRPLAVAAMEVATAVAWGALTGGRQAAEQVGDGRIAVKQFSLSGDHPEEDECDDHDGQVVDLDDEFADGDPPIHWGCSCYLDITLEVDDIAASASPTPTIEAPPEEAAMDPITFPAAQVAALVASCAERGTTLDLGALVAAADGSVTVEPGAAWHSMSVEEGFTTSDGREFAPGSLKTRPLSIPIMCLDTTSWGHETAFICGAVQAAERDGARIVTSGVFDSGPNGEKAQGYVERQMLRWVSIDAEVFEWEYVIENEDDLWDLLWWQDEGRQTARARLPVTASAEGERIALPVVNASRAGARTVAMVGALGGESHRSFETSNGIVERYLDAALMGVTICPFPAFPQAVIALEGTPLPDVSVDQAAGGDAIGSTGPTPVLVASPAIPECPPAEWFADPKLTGPTCVRITPEGRVFGHLARWDRAHISYATGEKVYAPRNSLVYQRFCKGSTEAMGADGPVEVRTGRIVIGADHADRTLSHAAATRFYAQACAGVANVVVGMDEWGPWVAGALDPGATPEQVRLFKACGSISGDWRPNRDEGGLRLAGVLVVNEPGFPIDEELTQIAAAAGLDHVPTARPAVHWVGEEMTSLVAAGALSRRDNVLGLVAGLRREVAELRSMVEPLQPMARRELMARAGVAASNGA